MRLEEGGIPPPPAGGGYCLVPNCSGVLYSELRREELWDKQAWKDDPSPFHANPHLFIVGLNI